MWGGPRNLHFKGFAHCRTYPVVNEALLKLHNHFKESRGVEYGHELFVRPQALWFYQSLPRDNNSKLSQSAVYQLSFVTDCHTEKNSLISLTQYNLANFLDGTAPTVVSGQIKSWLRLSTSQSFVDFFQNWQFDLFILDPWRHFIGQTPQYTILFS